VVTKWVGQSQANRIAVVSDELDADPFMKNIYLMAAPPNIKVDCFSNPALPHRGKKTSLATAACWCCSPPRGDSGGRTAGFDVSAIQVGGLAAGQTAKSYFRTSRWMKKTLAFFTT
jgi:D-glucosaminate-specific PTS system IIB component